MNAAGPTVVLFSRGRGRGHAIPDLAIIAELRSLCPGLDLQVASYAVGAETFRSHEEPVIDLELPEQNDFVETLLAAAGVLENTATCLVIAHEEPAALVAARVAGLRGIYLTHWFTGGRDLTSSSLRCADQIVFLGDRGWFDEPIEARGRVTYVGPVVRPLAYAPADRQRARAELALSPDEVVLLVLHGSPTDAIVPISGLVLAAFDKLRCSNKTLAWVVGRDRDTIEGQVHGRPDVRLIDTDWVVERWMVACDVAITKGTYNFALELAALGVPSLSLSNGHNYMDDLLLQRIPSNTPLWLDEVVTPERLVDSIEHGIATGRFPPNLSLLHNDGALRAAEAIATEISRARSIGKALQPCT